MSQGARLQRWDDPEEELGRRGLHGHMGLSGQAHVLHLERVLATIHTPASSLPSAGSDKSLLPAETGLTPDEALSAQTTEYAAETSLD
jgi:hypothetical protein